MKTENNNYRYPEQFLKDTEVLQKIISHNFKNPQFLYEALTHSSFSNEKKNGGAAPYRYNERLEFLGDSVLSVIVADYIYKKMPDFPEGDLTKLRSCVVCEDALYEYSKKIDLGAYLLLGHGEELTNGRERKSILADAFEALIAAIYLDGGMKSAAGFVMKFAKEKILLTADHKAFKDYKSLLQQIVQTSKGDILEYVPEREYGPAHDRTFCVCVYINNNKIGSGEGKTKREAEQAAAKKALELFGEGGE